MYTIAIEHICTLVQHHARFLVLHSSWELDGAMLAHVLELIPVRHQKILRGHLVVLLVGPLRETPSV